MLQKLFLKSIYYLKSFFFKSKTFEIFVKINMRAAAATIRSGRAFGRSNIIIPHQIPFCVSILQNQRNITAPCSLIHRQFAIKRTTTKRRSGAVSSKTAVAVADDGSAPPPPSRPLTVDEAWEPVKDEASGGIYYWNTLTNDVTHVGAEHPVLTAQRLQQLQGQSGGVIQTQGQQTGSGGMMSGLGGVVAQGMAFGVGSSIAHHAVGSILGGGGGGHHQSSDSGGYADSGSGGDFDGDFDL